MFEKCFEFFYEKNIPSYFLNFLSSGGFIFAFVNNQLIAQLRFLNIIPPYNVYLFEATVAKFSLNNKFPNYQNLFKLSNLIKIQSLNIEINSSINTNSYEIFEK